MFATFQSILALPLYYSQSGMMRRLTPPRFGGSFVQTGTDHFLSPLPERTTKVSLAYLQFETVADRDTLIAYVAIGSVAVMFCVGVHVVLGVMVVRRGVDGRRVPDLTSFGAVDLFTHCVMEGMEGVVGGKREGKIGGLFEGFVRRRTEREVEEGRGDSVLGVGRKGVSGGSSEVALVEVLP